MLNGLFLPTGEMVRRQAEPPAGVVEALQREVHPQLGLKFLPFQKAWCLVWLWDENDPRRRRVQMGHVTPQDAHTLIAFLPPDCPPEQAVGFARRQLVINPPTEMWEKVRERVERHNENVEQAVMDAALADVHNRIDMMARSHVTGHHRDMFAGAEETDEVGEAVGLTKEERKALAAGEPIV